jgi:acyl-CoA reductase-like NAD-dependent aldehyde dehydrogenase
MSAHHAKLRGPKGEDIQVPVGLWIDGQLVSSSQNRTFETISAVSGKTLTTLQEGNEADVDKAVIAAQKVSDDKLKIFFQ